MFCCSNCFTDSFLIEHINAISNKKGNCSFCKSKNVTLIDPENLYDRFEPLIDLYEVDKNGKKLIDLIQSDWRVFSSKSPRVLQKLLNLIANDEQLLVKRYRPKYSIDKRNIEQWEDFREELKHRNRFFPLGAPNIEQLEPFGKYLGVIIKKNKQKFYRARVNDTASPYSIKEMGKPDKKMASIGRANPLGIAYLYVASTIDTAISEVRGHKGESLTIAEYLIIDDLELADLRDPKERISPFMLNDEDELELIYKNMPFLTLLGEELSKPIIPREANLEYLPSQYLCEMLKLIGFHGIIYKSSIADGNNYVIFTDERVKCQEIYNYKIVDVKTTSIKV